MVSTLSLSILYVLAIALLGVGLGLALVKKVQSLLRAAEFIIDSLLQTAKSYFYA
ncbi:MAG: hypothetical protein ACLRPU_01750 [Enterococcus hulanensis]